MQQVWQDNKGHLTTGDVPVPAVPYRGILVHNRYSLISSGTERALLTLSRKSLLSKARARPDLARQVLSKVRTEGLAQTLRKVDARLEQPVALGYSCAGVVVESSTEAYRGGDRVACAGMGYASHSEFVGVPQNLVAAVPENVSDRSAATVTVGAIALQGVRQAEPQIGETIAVIGLGLVGQITAMILNANGCRVIGFDPDVARTDLAMQHGARMASTQLSPDDARRMVGTRGADRVIITAASGSNGPVELAAALCRDRGRLVLVGDVKADLPRQPFYRKELELRYARSYGPGRYDPRYEEQGIDYPESYVRWTEQRNMASYLDLIATGAISTDHLITHSFDIAFAEKAYGIIAGDAYEPHLGILLRYPEESTIRRRITLRKPTQRPAADHCRVGFIGAGRFAQSVLLPALIKQGVSLHTLCARSGINVAAAARKFGFQKATTDAQSVLADPEIDLIMLATPHHLHARHVVAAIRAGKAVFVEKPLACSRQELNTLESLYGEHPVPVMVGFNRRFAPLTEKLKSAFKNRFTPMVIHYRILAGTLPAGSPWQSPETGGRITGEVCHFVDYCRYLTGSEVIGVQAAAAVRPGAATHPPDNLQVILTFADASIATITYVADADPGVGKEEITVMGDGRTAILHDFRRLDIWSGGRRRRTTTRQDKGHVRQLQSLVEALKNGTDMPIPWDELVNVTQSTLAISEALSGSNTATTRVMTG